MIVKSRYILLLALISGCGKPSGTVSQAAKPSLIATSEVSDATSPEADVMVLARQLANNDPKVRFTAAEALWRMGPKCAPALPQLIEHIDDEEWAHFENPRRGAQVRTMVDRAIGQIEDGVVPLLLTCLDSPKPARRRNAAELLAARKDLRAVEPMIKLLTDSNRLVRAVVAERLGYFAAPQAAPPLRAALKDEDWYVRMKAASALARTKSNEVVPDLLIALQDSEENVRSAAAEALGVLEDARAVPALANAAKADKSQYVRRAATESLKRIEKLTEQQNTAIWKTSYPGWCLQPFPR